MEKESSLVDALQVLIGEQLSSVEFVLDYVQLRFNGPCFTVYTNIQRHEKRHHESMGRTQLS